MAECWSVTAAYHADTSFEFNPPSYSMLRMVETPPVDGDTAWTSQYGTYDALSPAFKQIVDNLHAVHSSRLQYETILTLWGGKPRRAPVDTVHPLVRTHPVTGLKALNWNPGFGIWIDELNKEESGTLTLPFVYRFIIMKVIKLTPSQMPLESFSQTTSTRLLIIKFAGAGHQTQSPSGTIGYLSIASFLENIRRRGLERERQSLANVLTLIRKVKGDRRGRKSKDQMQRPKLTPMASFQTRINKYSLSCCDFRTSSVKSVRSLSAFVKWISSD